jgi:D-alanyl-D-alanine-carboxypeptidase/D-alanyl-D-alanine-endopeptidase
VGRTAQSSAAIILGAALALVGCQRAPAPPPPAQDTKPALIEAAVNNLYADSQAVGLVIAVVRPAGSEVRGFGHPAPYDPGAVTGKTLVRLESISKLFAADVLSARVAAGQMRLEDPLTLYAPPGWVAPKEPRDAAAIALINLASHTSGLPREAGLKPAGSEAAAAQARWAWLAKQRKLDPPGKQAQYSNIAFDVLGDALADQGKTSYAAAVAATVTGPLGMADTTLSPTLAQCARLMSPDPVRPPHPCIDQSNHAASGGLYSTGDDMALWLKAQLAPGGAADRRRISQAMYFQRAALKPAIGLDHAGPASAVGLGWLELPATAEHPPLLEKTGGGDGFLTYVVIDPVKRVGVFVAFDNVSGRRMQPVTRDANALIELLGAP